MEGIIIVINPGSTTTRMALFKGKEKIAEETVNHSREEIAPFENVADQFELRMTRWLTNSN